VNALTAQLREYSLPAKDNLIDSVYIGGGTPTSIGTENLLKIIRSIKSFYVLSKNTEFTLEVNPKTIDLKGLKKLYKAGVNRLSIGMQSAHGKELKLLSRIHTAGDFADCYRNARLAGFKNISLDIMYGIPSQTPESFLSTLRKAMTMQPDHISAYGLKIEPGTLFHRNYDRIQKYLPTEEQEREMYFTCCNLLERNGYKQYEISNFSRPGYECRHNLKYWTCGEYIGLGTGAHSYFSDCRFSFKKDIKEYLRNFNYDRAKLQSVDIFDFEKFNLFDEHTEIKPNERIGEYVMLGLRLKAGIDKNKFAQIFYMDFDRMYYAKIEPFIGSGHIVRTSNGYAFSQEGMFVSNYILGRILDI
jgi:oxygen-independent coproporphyrinogen-3 oxidase